jgi:hypothetical protein
LAIIAVFSSQRGVCSLLLIRARTAVMGG